MDTSISFEENLAKRKTLPHLPPPVSDNIKSKIFDAKKQKNYGYEFKLYSHTINFSLKKNQYVLVNIDYSEPIFYSSSLLISKATDSTRYPEFASIDQNLKEKERKTFPIPFVIENSDDAEKILGISCDSDLYQINLKDYPLGLYIRSDCFIAATDGIKFQIYKFEEDDQILWIKISGMGFIWTRLPINSNIITQKLTLTQSIGTCIDNILGFAHSGTEEPNLKMQHLGIISRSSRVSVFGPGELLISSISFRKPIVAAPMKIEQKEEVKNAESTEKKEFGQEAAKKHTPIKENPEDLWNLVDPDAEKIGDQKKKSIEDENDGEDINFSLQKQLGDSNNFTEEPETPIENEQKTETQKDASEQEGYI